MSGFMAPPITAIVERHRLERPKGTVRFQDKGPRYVLSLEQMEQLALDLLSLVDELRAEYFADGYVEES
jgi:hypothetical protein